MEVIRAMKRGLECRLGKDKFEAATKKAPRDATPLRYYAS
jgi:hypothetical protein